MPGPGLSTLLGGTSVPSYVEDGANRAVLDKNVDECLFYLSSYNYFLQYLFSISSSCYNSFLVSITINTIG